MWLAARGTASARVGTKNHFLIIQNTTSLQAVNQLGVHWRFPLLSPVCDFVPLLLCGF